MPPAAARRTVCYRWTKYRRVGPIWEWFCYACERACDNTLNCLYRGMLKFQGSPQTGRGTQLVLGSSSTDKNYQLSIQRGYTNGFPTNKYCLSLSFGNINTVSDLITTNFQPNYDQFYEIRAIRFDGQWSLYVDGSLVGTAQDPGAFNQLENIVLYSVGSVAVDDIRVATAGDHAIEVFIGGQVRGSYALASGEERREYYDLSGGPVVVNDENGGDIVAAIRLQSKPAGTLYSFVETMGVPSGLLSYKYYFPTYNNTWGPLNSQIRFGNLDINSTTIRVTIGGNVVWEQSVPGLEERRLYFDVSGGPVVIESLDTSKKT